MNHIDSDMDQSLRAMADAAASDIKLEYPAMDTNYDLYIEALPGYGIIGVIDIGDVFQAAYAWERDHWTLLNQDPVMLRDMITKKRGS